MGTPVASTRFESAADGLLTELVEVTAGNRRATTAGSVAESGVQVVTSLRCSIQPRASLDVRTVMGRMPEMSHMLYCRAEDANAVVLDIHKGDRVAETTANRKPRRFRILTEPSKFPDFDTRGWHHLEMELAEDLYA